jgi:methyl-accepting chemotaxis protein
MSLTRKLMMGFCGMLGLLMLISAAALVITRDLSGELDRAAKLTERAQYLAGEVDAKAAQMIGLERATMLATVLGDGRAAQYQQNFANTTSRLLEVLRELHGTATGPEAAKLLENLDQQAVLVGRAHEEFRSTLANGQMDEGLKIFTDKGAPGLENMQQQASALVEQESRYLQSNSAASAAKSWRGVAVMIALALIGLIAGGAVLGLVLHTNRNLLSISRRLAESAQQVGGAAEQVSGASRSLAQGASEQAASLEETSASTEEIASITRQNADHAQQAAGLVQQSASGATEVNQMLDRMVEKMREIDGASHKIARIIKVIDEIAFQTNILALNAAVEAARAGEAGLGFAVVADEVRNLAQRSAEAARDTAALIEESITTAQDGNGRLNAMAGSVRALTEGSLRVKSLVDEVNQGSQEQARGMEQIAQAVLQMEQVTQKTAASAEESASAGAELNGYAAELRTVVEEMRTMVGA